MFVADVKCSQATWQTVPNLVVVYSQWQLDGPRILT